MTELSGRGGAVTPDAGLRPELDRLAQMLADERGAEILAELQKLSYITRSALPRPTPRTDQVGIWQVEVTADGVGLRRSPANIDPDWANVDHVPPASGLQRVVLLGESAARGWPYDPLFNCALALGRQLEQAAPGRYQCVDLAKTGATATDLDWLASALPALRPDVVIIFAGNNWTLGQHEIEARAPDLEQIARHDELARALRDEGLAGMKRVLSEVTIARASGFLERIAAVQNGHAVDVVVVIPEFNLRGWVPPADIETPLLAPAALAEWHARYLAATGAADEGRWGDVVPIADQMRRLDGGSSPVPGYLEGRAAEALGDGAAARIAFEDSRDAVCGVLVRYTPRVTSPVQRLLSSYAAERGWRCVDLRSVLAAPDLPELPDERFFHDYCHLSDLGIETAMAAVADAVLGCDRGTTQPGPGLPAPLRAFGHAHAATHLAYTGQPAGVVAEHLRAAVQADPSLVSTFVAVRDLLSAPRPVWGHPAATALASIPPVVEFLIATARMRDLPSWVWTLRECLSLVVGPETTGDCRGAMDLLAGPDGGGQALPSWLPGRCHHQATARRSSLAFALDRPTAGTLELTYRMPCGTPDGTAEIALNGSEVGELRSRRGWTDATLRIHAGLTRPGVNRIDIRWPVPAPDAAALLAADAAALARGELPFMLPVFGELFAGWMRLDRPTLAHPWS
jgi:hypothetical protein